VIGDMIRNITTRIRNGELSWWIKRIFIFSFRPVYLDGVEAGKDREGLEQVANLKAAPPEVGYGKGGIRRCSGAAAPFR
jgi:hypothetical protein